MAFYLNQQNLYGSPNPVLANANLLSGQINAAGSGYANFNGMTGCFPLTSSYSPVPGYAAMPTSPSAFGYGYGGETSISYSNGTYSYHNGPSTLDYVSAIGGGIAAGIGAYYSGKAAQAQAQTAQEAQRMQHLAYQNESERMYAMQDRIMQKQESQDSMNNMLQMMMMMKMMEKMDF